jgi:excinuclease ABC subunit A
VRSQSAEEIVDLLLAYPAGAKILVLAPIIKERKGHHQPVFEDLRKSGFTRARVNGRVLELAEDIELDRYKQHSIEAVVDRLVIPARPAEAGEEAESYREFQSRLTDSVETGLKLGSGTLIVSDVTSAGEPTDRLYSEHFACPVDGISLPDFEPRTFSFNTPHGACQRCQGLGVKLEIDPDLVIPNPDLSISEGAITVMEWRNSMETGGYYWQSLEAAAHHYRIPLDAPVRGLSEAKLKILLYGSGGEKVRMHYTTRDGRHSTWDTPYEGIIPNLRRRYDETNSDYIREKISEYMSERPCEVCGGRRLRPEALAVTVGEHNIIDVTGWPVVGGPAGGGAPPGGQ